MGLKECISSDMIKKLEEAQRQYLNMKKEYVLSKYSIPSQPGKDGFYRVMIKDRTKKSGRSTIAAKSIEELKEKLYKREQSLSNSSCQYTIDDIFKLVLKEKMKYIKGDGRIASATNTVSKNETDYKRFFNDTTFQRLDINTVTKKDIEEFIFLNLDRYDLRKKALGSLKGILNMIFNYAYNEEIIEQNPLTKVSLRKFKNMLDEEADIKKRYHSEDDICRILDCIEEYHRDKPSYIPAYALELQIYTAMRRGELPPLLWDDVFEDSIYIHREQITVKRRGNIKEHDIIVDHTKTHQDRMFPITDEIELYFKRLKRVHTIFYPDSEFLFPDDTDNGCISNHVVYQLYYRICSKLKIPINREFQKGTHAFRRTRITNFINKSKGNIIMASDIFGNTVEVAKKYYFVGSDLQEAKKYL